ncbi:hypothetical protein V0288_13970 [Pannus brasiliensis CCIBt3594]|uniref:Uncharacterized protein n=1 Tax=Pannus brasiliensis CCIBt3594 TaxID=1427578 RepID=A0AAW9QVR0_9CHRO
MSKGNLKKKISSLRQQFHHALDEEGFVQEIPITESSTIEIIESSDDSKLKKVTLEDLAFSPEVDKIWTIDLESKKYPGLSTGDATPEKAILILQKKMDGDIILNYHLVICLVELKSSLQSGQLSKDKTLKQIYKKFQCAMNRMYMLLTLNNHANPQKNYQDKEIHIRFRGLIFYNNNDIKKNDITDLNSRAYHDNEEGSLYEILTDPDRRKILSLSTLILDRDGIEIKFIQNPDRTQDQMTIPLKDLLDRQPSRKL